MQTSLQWGHRDIAPQLLVGRIVWRTRVHKASVGSKGSIVVVDTPGSVEFPSVGSILASCYVYVLSKWHDRLFQKLLHM